MSVMVQQESSAADTKGTADFCCSAAGFGEGHLRASVFAFSPIVLKGRDYDTGITWRGSYSHSPRKAVQETCAGLPGQAALTSCFV